MQQIPVSSPTNACFQVRGREQRWVCNMYISARCNQGCSLWLWNLEETSPEVQNSDISGPTKRTNVLQILQVETQRWQDMSDMSTLSMLTYLRKPRFLAELCYLTGNIFGVNLVQTTCGRRADDVRMMCRWHENETSGEISLEDDICHPHVVCTTALHKAYWLTC